MNQKYSDYLFETSWEICNKVGGIYTVLSTKAATVVGNYHDHYICIGPDISKEYNDDFVEDPTLFTGNLDWFAATNAWSLDNQDSDQPRIGSTVSNGGVNRSSFYSRNASFLRLKNVEIGYTIPMSRLIPKLGVAGLRFYVAGYNLLTLSELKFVDPETSDESYQTYPQMRIVNTGLKLSF